jgi:hypothetical protein
VPDQTHAFAGAYQQGDILQCLHGTPDAPAAPEVADCRLERTVKFGANSKLEIDVFEVNGGHDC